MCALAYAPFFLHSYRNRQLWADGTIPYGVHVHKSVSRQPWCGFMENLYGQSVYRVSEMSTLPVHLYACSANALSSMYHLCEFPTTQNGTESRHSESVVTISAPRQNDVVPSWVSCPTGHLTHTFLACLVHSACWAGDDVTYGSARDFWDIPSYTTCPAPLSLLPPSYACASRGDRVPYTFVCDHLRDCSDNSDESFCQHQPCGGTSPLQCGDISQVSS